MDSVLSTISMTLGLAPDAPENKGSLDGLSAAQVQVLAPKASTAAAMPKA